MTLLKALTTAAALAALPAQAATVVYSVAHLAKDGSDIGLIDTAGSFGGTAFTAWQSGSLSPTNPYSLLTLNGYTFLPSTPGSGPANGSFYWGDNSNGHITTSPYTYSINSAGIDRGNDSGVAYTAGSNLYGVVYDAIQTSANNVPLTVTLSGLIVGKSYEFQALFSADNGNGDLNDRLLFLPGNTPPSDHPDGGTTNGNADLAYGPTSGPGLLKGFFTADSATQTFTFSNIDQDNERVSLAAIFLSVPEASSSALMILGATAGLLRRRRR